ncbi:MAG: YitT family protein [Methanomassiliicoccales archaeon]
MHLTKSMTTVTTNLRKFTETISIKDILGIMLGAFILAIGIEIVLVPAHLLTGGITGIALMLQFLTGVEVWIWVLAINAPIFFAGYKFISRRFAFYSLIGMLVLTFFLGISRHWQVDIGISNPLLSAILGGVILGLGSGICLRSKGSTGGLDIVAVIVRRFWGYNFGTVSFAVNLIVLGIMLVTSTIELTLFSAIGIFVSSQVIDWVQNGTNVSKTALIVTGMADDIAHEIMHDLNRGCTLLSGTGAYTGEARDIIMVTVGITQMPRLREIVFQLDPHAFITINETIEVYGKGFKSSGQDF